MNSNFLNLIKNIEGVSPVIPQHILNGRFFVFDFSKENPNLKFADIYNTPDFENYIEYTLVKNGATFGIGKYNEDRTIYQGNMYSGQHSRTVHLGVDIFLPARTKISSPLNGKIHSFANNKNKGDYGPTIILEHSLQGQKFYTLYGHLSLRSLSDIYEGKIINAGDTIGEVGERFVNGGWPPHLHFQIIKDMQGKKGDFFGVASKKDTQSFLDMCPNPNLILKIKGI